MLAQDGRLESEYKLDIPTEDVDALWTFIQETYGTSSLMIDGQALVGTSSVETFIDSYYDNEDQQLAATEVSLRYRKRFKDGQLLKELIQLKLPYSTDKVVRNEIKFRVSKQKTSSQLYAGHPLLKYLDNADKDKLQYHLSTCQLRPEAMQPSVKLSQLRHRVYIQDSTGESIATITMDKVNHFSLPFLSYAELELELNELKYTAATETERQYMTALNDKIKTQLSENFPGLQVDQRTKYSKMLDLVNESRFANIWEHSIWLFFGAITFSAIFLYLKDQYS